MYKGKFENTTAAPTPRPRKRRRGITPGTLIFYGLLIAFVLVFCIGMSIAMGALNNWLVRFEASQPTAKCEAVFNQLFQEPNWQDIYQLSGTSTGITAEDYASYMEQKVGQEKLTYIETSAGLSGDKKYIVRCGSEKVATFTLCNQAPDTDSPDWQLGTVEIFYTARLSITVMAPPDHTVLVNGQELDESYVIRSVSTKAEEFLPEGVHGYRMNELLLEDLLTEPEVQVLDSQGSPVELNYDSQTRCYSVEAGSPEITEEHRQTLVNVAETYCKYMIGDASRTALRNCFDSSSDIYKTITQNTTWMQNYASYKLGTAEISDYYCYSDEYYSARVALTLKVTRKDGSIKEYQLDNTFFLKKTGDQWKVWEMINSNPQDTVTAVRLSFVVDDQVIHTEMVDAQSSKLTLPQVTVPEGKTFTGWFTQKVDEAGATTLELAFEPSEDGTVRLPADAVLEPMTLYALYQ